MKKSKILRLSKDAIAGAGFTQRSLGEAVGINESRISLATHGKFNFSPEERTRIASAIGRPESEVFYAAE